MAVGAELALEFPDGVGPRSGVARDGGARVESDATGVLEVARRSSVGVLGDTFRRFSQEREGVDSDAEDKDIGGVPLDIFRRRFNSLDIDRP